MAETKNGAKAYCWPKTSNWNEFINNFTNLIEDSGYVTYDGNLSGLKKTLSINPSLFFVHWIDEMFTGNRSILRIVSLIIRFFLGVALLKLKRVKLVWVVHNLKPHNTAGVHSFLYSVTAHLFSIMIDGWITLAPSTRYEVIKKYPLIKRKPHVTVWHPMYQNYFNENKSVARKELSIPNERIVFGHVGMLREYKGLLSAYNMFLKFADKRHYLLYAGSIYSSESYKKSLRLCFSSNDNSMLIEKMLSRREFDAALTGVDVFIAPYEEMLHSGAIIHALCRGCVVVASETPFTRDLKDKLGRDWLVLFEGEFDSSHLSSAADMSKRLSGEKPDLSFLSSTENAKRLKILLNSMGVSSRDCSKSGG